MQAYSIIGPPGTGKTWYLVGRAAEAAEKFGKHSVLLASLTRTAATEIRQRKVDLPEEAVGTLHAHAYRALGRPQLVLAKQIGDWNDQASSPRWVLSGAPRGDDDVDAGREDDREGEGPGDRLLERATLHRARCDPLDAWPDQETVDFHRAWTAWKKASGLVDFEDLISLAIERHPEAPGSPRVIYVDEAQDHSRSELRLAIHWGKSAGALVAVGDADQAIFTWRGASPDDFLSIAPREHRKVLDQSYRVPRAVHAHAVKWIEQMPGREPVAYRPRDADGAVVENMSTNFRCPEWAIDHALEQTERGKSCMLLVSCRYMLSSIKAIMRNRGIPFHNPYRKKSGDWNPLRAAGRIVNYLAPSDEAWSGDSRPWTWSSFWSWLEFVDSRFLVRGAKKYVEEMARGEKTGDLTIGADPDDAMATAVACFAPGVNVFDGRAETLAPMLLMSKRPQMEYPMRVAQTFGARALVSDPQIVIGTIHSVKGAEADVVYVFPDLSPQQSHAREDVLRAFYVAFTRARETLVLCGAVTPVSAW